MSDPGARRFEIVIGKGGVGRTTVAAAMAAGSSRAGRRTLLASTATQEIVTRLVGPPKVGTVNTRMSPTLEAVAMQPWACIEEYTLMMLRLRSLQRFVFGNRFMKSFVTGIPGIYEWAILGKSTYHVMERKGGRPRYDRIVLDAPATGHGLALLRVPLLIKTAVGSGPVLRDANERWRLMTDDETTRVVLVTLAEEMVVTETLQLSSQIVSELGLTIGLVVINKVIPPVFDETEEQTVLSLVDRGGASPRMRAAALRIHRTRIQRSQIVRLRDSLKMPFLELPLLATRQFSRRALEHLSQFLSPCSGAEQEFSERAASTCSARRQG